LGGILFKFINTKKDKQWMSLVYLKSKNIDGRGGLKIIDVEKYMKEALPEIQKKIASIAARETNKTQN
jgi:hypothetical protein